MTAENLVMSICIAIIMMALVACQEFLLTGGFTRFRGRREYAGRVSATGWLKAIAFGLFTGLAFYLAPLNSVVAVIALVVMIILMICNTYWAFTGVSRWYELLVTAGIFAILAIVAYNVATKIVIVNYGWSTFTLVLPWIVLAICGGIVLVNFFVYHSRGLHRARPERLEENARALYGLGAILSAVAAIVVIILLLVNRVYWPGFYAEPRTSAQGEENISATIENDELAPSMATADPWYAFFNPSLLYDDDPSNDFNFGWNPLTWEHTEAEYYDDEFRARLKVDPALTASATAWLDANVGIFFSCRQIAF